MTDTIRPTQGYKCSGPPRYECIPDIRRDPQYKTINECKANCKGPMVKK